MAVSSMSRNGLYNDPGKSQVAGKIKTTYFPVAAELKSKYEVAPAKVEFWSMAIPNNSKNKDLAWAFIKAMSSKEAAVNAALNGNGPIRASTYDDPRIKAELPYADSERKVLQVSRVPLPAFDNAARAADFFKEEAEAAVLGMKSPQQAMDDLTSRCRSSSVDERRAVDVLSEMEEDVARLGHRRHAPAHHDAGGAEGQHFRIAIRPLGVGKPARDVPGPDVITKHYSRLEHPVPGRTHEARRLHGEQPGCGRLGGKAV